LTNNPLVSEWLEWIVFLLLSAENGQLVRAAVGADKGANTNAGVKHLHFSKQQILLRAGGVAANKARIACHCVHCARAIFEAFGLSDSFRTVIGEFFFAAEWEPTLRDSNMLSQSFVGNICSVVLQFEH
jgi:hypothetical protein